MQSAETVMERVVGIEPTSPAWKAGVIAFIRYPLWLMHYGFRLILGTQIAAFLCYAGILRISRFREGAKYTAAEINVQPPSAAGKGHPGYPVDQHATPPVILFFRISRLVRWLAPEDRREGWMTVGLRVYRLVMERIKKC